MRARICDDGLMIWDTIGLKEVRPGGDGLSMLIKVRNVPVHIKDLRC